MFTVCPILPYKEGGKSGTGRFRPTISLSHLIKETRRADGSLKGMQFLICLPPFCWPGHQRTLRSLTAVKWHWGGSSGPWGAVPGQIKTTYTPRPLTTQKERQALYDPQEAAAVSTEMARSFIAIIAIGQAGLVACYVVKNQHRPWDVGGQRKREGWPWPIY